MKDRMNGANILKRCSKVTPGNTTPKAMYFREGLCYDGIVLLDRKTEQMSNERYFLVR